MKPKKIVLIGSIFYGAGLIGTGCINTITLLYLSYGIIAGIGMTLVYPLVLSHMVKFFPEKKGVISGVMAASYGMGAIIWAPTGAALIESFGVSKAFIIMGISMMVVIAVASRFVGDPPTASVAIEEISESAARCDYESRDKSWEEMIRTPQFYILFIMFAIGTTAGLMIIAHASPIVQSAIQVSPKSASLIVSLFVAASVSGKLFWGVISDKVGRFQVLIILFIGVAVPMFILAASPDTPLFIAAMVIVELCYGGFIAMIAPLTADIFGNKHLSINYGIMFVTFAVGGIIGPIIASIIREVDGGSYTRAFFIAGGLAVVGIILANIAVFISNKEKYKNFLEM